ncbi:MAG: cytochrome C oxidase subunit IV family protein [Myxococcales bacterium]|nr:cytochrome C oxidase subunit IV family protein [Polyangiaceae bacterium]MDW8251867.1 cytochrome C oxidase subunit IV family protein [Myxococcales bacterium]
MATSETHNHDHDHGDSGHHVDPLWLYLAVFGALLVMTAVTVGASYIDFGAASVAVAVLIATVKAFLVAFFFMHLRHDKPFHSLVLVSGLLFLSFLFLFTLSDHGTRNDVDDMHGKPIVNPAPTASK